MLRSVTSYTMSPLGAKGWILTLECGHKKHLWTLPRGKLVAFCDECDKAPLSDPCCYPEDGPDALCPACKATAQARRESREREDE